MSMNRRFVLVQRVAAVLIERFGQPAAAPEGPPPRPSLRQRTHSGAPLPEGPRDRPGHRLPSCRVGASEAWSDAGEGAFGRQPPGERFSGLARSEGVVLTTSSVLAQGIRLNRNVLDCLTRSGIRGVLWRGSWRRRGRGVVARRLPGVLWRAKPRGSASAGGWYWPRAPGVVARQLPAPGCGLLVRQLAGRLWRASCCAAPRCGAPPVAGCVARQLVGGRPRWSWRAGWPRERVPPP